MSEVVPRAAATVVLLRDAPDGVEVLLLERSAGSTFVPGAFVFPGGAVDDDDRDGAVSAACAGLDDLAASARLGVDVGGLAYWIAAIRECFEEAGLLLATDREGNHLRLDTPDRSARFEGHRSGLRRGTVSFTQIVEREGLRLATDRLHYLAHWITPVGVSKRYDARFFLAVAPEGQTPAHDDEELVSHRWMRPEQALAGADAGELQLRTPTRTTLLGLVGAASAAAAVERTAARGAVPAILPVIAPDGRRLLPGEPGYDEQGRVDG